MATAIRFKELRQAFPEGFAWPSRAEVEDRVRKARRMAADAKHTAEDLAADATLRVRRRPLTAVAAAAGVGLVAGAAFGFVAGFFAKTRPCGE